MCPAAALWALSRLPPSARGTCLAAAVIVARPAELQIERPDKFLKHERRFQRVGVMLLTLFVLAGVAGAFGDGPLGRATTTGGTLLRYERFGRTTVPTLLTITVNAAVADGAPVRFRIARAFLQDVDSLELRPPDALKALEEPDGVVRGRGCRRTRSCGASLQPRPAWGPENDCYPGAS